MINISLSSSGKPYVWDADSWLTLRQKHRIVGALDGVLSNFPNQDNCSGLPMALLPEETALLLEKKLARLVRFPCLERCPGDGIREVYKEHLDQTKNEQEELMKEERKKTLSGLIDKIIEGRRRKQLGLDTKKKKNKSKKVKLEEDDVKKEGGNEVNVKVEDSEEGNNQVQSGERTVKVEDLGPIDDTERDAVMQEELSKIPSLSKEHTLVQTFTAYPWLREEDACSVEWNFPESPDEKYRYQTFKDLWEKGHYVTSGHKFGGDFLVYPGDPMKFHSQFIVRCVDHLQPISVLELISYGRISSTVRKTFVLASVPSDSDKVVYQSIKWPGASLSALE